MYAQCAHTPLELNLNAIARNGRKKLFETTFASWCLVSLLVAFILGIFIFFRCVFLHLSELQARIEEAVDTLDLVDLFQGWCIVLLEVFLT